LLTALTSYNTYSLKINLGISSMREFTKSSPYSPTYCKYYNKLILEITK